MRQIFSANKTVLLLLILGSLSTPLSSFADQKTAQTTVGITFITSGAVPTPNQVLPDQVPTNAAQKLPQTNSVFQPLLSFTGLGLLLMSGLVLLIKRRKEDNKSNE